MRRLTRTFVGGGNPTVGNRQSTSGGVEVKRFRTFADRSADTALRQALGIQLAMVWWNGSG